jgi:hypothetical protein
MTPVVKFSRELFFTFEYLHEFEHKSVKVSNFVKASFKDVNYVKKENSVLFSSLTYPHAYRSCTPFNPLDLCCLFLSETDERSCLARSFKTDFSPRSVNAVACICIGCGVAKYWVWLSMVSAPFNCKVGPPFDS